VNLPGKVKALRTKRGIGLRASRHKAYVYLNKGDTIQFA
jgi:ribosomal protein L23